jgi:breast cancer 2 susceptibility protein
MVPFLKRFSSFGAIAVTFTVSCRVSKIAEDIMFEQQENCDSTDDNEEGAKICKMLERTAEPEVIMAGMTSEQLMHFSSYKEKQKVSRSGFC